MSVELPRLEQLLADAAERHYGPRRARIRLPRLRVAIGVAAVAAAAVALAIAVLPLRTDEQAATPPATDPAAALASKYSVFAHHPQPTALENDVLLDESGFLNPKLPTATRLLRQFKNGGVVAVTGTTDGTAEQALCLRELYGSVGGGACTPLADLLGRHPVYVQQSFYEGVGNVTNAFVPDDVRAVRFKVEGGDDWRDVPIQNNLAYARSDRAVCRVEWTTRDDAIGHEDFENGIKVGPGDPVPPAC